MKKRAKLRKPVLKQLQKGNVKGQFIQTQPIWVRVFHWGFAFSLTGILLTALELHKPASFLALNFGDVLMVHLIFNWFALGFVAIRLVDALIRRDRSLILKSQELMIIPKLLAYYFFLRSSPPPKRKYNPLQIILYASWILLFLVASLLGSTLYWQGKYLIWVWRLMGGGQVIRWIAYVATIYFLATIPLHIYLSLTEDISHLQAMITGYERKPPPNNS